MSDLIYANSTTLPPSQYTQDPTSTSSLNSSLPLSIQNLLKNFFNQIDLQGSDQISHKDLTSKLASASIKFHDKHNYDTFHYYPNVHGLMLNFEQFLKLMENLRLSQGDLWKMNNTVSTVSTSHYSGKLEKAKGPVQYKQDEIKEGYTNEKVQMFRKVFNELDSKGTGTLGWEELKRLLETINHKCTEEELGKFFQELDFENKGHITFEDVMKSYRTKLGNLCAYNLAIMSKKASNPQDAKQQSLICLQKYREEERIDEEELLDLAEVYQLFDSAGKTFIDCGLLKECQEGLQNQLSEQERAIFTSLASFSTENISFYQLLKKFRDNGSDIIHFISLAAKFSKMLWNNLITYFLDKYYWSQQSRKENDKEFSAYVIEEEKSPLYSTVDSLQSFSHGMATRGSCGEVTGPSPNKKQNSVLSAPDIETCQYRKAINKTGPKYKISSIQDGLELESPDLKGSNLKGIGRSSVTDSTCEITPELKTSSKDLLKNAKQKDPLHLPCSLESLVEDEEDSDKLQSNQKLEEQELLKLENAKLRQALEEREKEIVALKENHSVEKSELEDDIAVKTNLITRVSKEQEAVKAHLELAKEEVEQLKIKMNDSAMKLKKANDETITMKKRLATKVKEALIQKERFDAIEKQYHDKSREVETLVKNKLSDEKTYQDNIAGMKGKLNYLTQKFTEYLTQNTSLQSELQEKTTAVKKIDTAFKDHIKKSDDQRQKLDLRICELEQQVKDASTNTCQMVEKETETDTPFSPIVSKRKMELQIADVMSQNQNLKDVCCGFQKETQRLQHELVSQHKEMNKLRVSHENSMKDVESEMQSQDKISQTNDGIAKTLIESLCSEIDSLKLEKEILENMLKTASGEIEDIKQKNSDLTTKASEYQLEFKYLSECLNESLWKSNGSNDSVIIFGHERNEEMAELETPEVERNLKTDDISAKDPRKSLKIVQEYVGKLETLEQRTKNLDDEIELMNDKIETLRQRNKDEDQASTETKGILDVYKKLIENKQLEIENLKKRVRGKTGLLSANMRLLSKLETLFTQKLNELSEVNQTQDQLSIENKKLNSTIKDQIKEIQKLKEQLVQHETERRKDSTEEGQGEQHKSDGEPRLETRAFPYLGKICVI